MDGVLVGLLVIAGDDVLQIIEIGVIHFVPGRSAAWRRRVVAYAAAGPRRFLSGTSGCTFPAASTTPTPTPPTHARPFLIRRTRFRRDRYFRRFHVIDVQIALYVQIQVGIAIPLELPFRPGAFHPMFGARPLLPFVAPAPAPAAASAGAPFPVFLLALAARQLDFRLLLG